MDLLTKQAILDAAPTFKDVPVPEWGGTVRVWAMSGVQRAKYLAAQFDDAGKLRNPEQTDAVLAAFTIGDDTGQPLFTADDITALAQTSGAALLRVARVAAQLSGLTTEAVAEAQKN